MENQKSSWLDQMVSNHPSKPLPFSFTYDGKDSEALLGGWQYSRNLKKGDGRLGITTMWTDTQTGFRVIWEAAHYGDFPAVEWIVYFENAGPADTPIISDVQALSLFLPAEQSHPWVLHRANGGPAKPWDYEPAEITLDADHPAELGGGEGRSSAKDLPFFKLESGDRSLIVAVGWSGQWHASFGANADKGVHVRAGLELTHFLLHPGEKVRSPRMLLLDWHGDTLESNNAFRQLIYQHIAARRLGPDGKRMPPEPIPFCNTCFTRGGGWLNECNEQNQISLIRAYAPLGLEALITDAGWFEGGWPNGAGNWTPRKDAYPHGMAPVAAAAKQHGMIYGLWFEPERVINGTSIHKEHPEWCLTDGQQTKTLLADFGRPEVRDYFFNIVKGFMALPGFRFYRQDFNTYALAFWRHADPPDRQGISEMKYIEGLYAYWDRIASAWPDGIREQCTGGGHRTDLETVSRMHTHQSSDRWFQNDEDQARTWSLSRYLPNSIFDLPICRLDEYTFRSVMSSSLVLGWIADASDFDTARAKALMDKYLAHRELIVGSYYPLLPYSREPGAWMAYQFHRADLGHGMVLAFRHAESGADSQTLALHGLEPEASYRVAFDTAARSKQISGANLMKGLTIAVAEKPGSELVTYRRL